MRMVNAVRQHPSRETEIRDVKREFQSVESASSVDSTSMQKSATIWSDHTHVGRRASGIERITSELFSESALLPFKSKASLAGTGRFGVMAAQMFGLPWFAVRNPPMMCLFFFSGFPPSPYFSMVPERSVLYVHDLFLLTRREQLNMAGEIPCSMALPIPE